MLGSLRASPPYDSDNKGKLILSAELLSLAARRAYRGGNPKKELTAHARERATRETPRSAKENTNANATRKAKGERPTYP
eukprot:scaffold102146_cov35-Tisochrysis_lutea.AAC.1